METSAPWPTNRYGTTWRRAILYFDWRDEEIVWEAIETTDPLKITVRERPVAVIGFDCVADMMMHRLADTLPFGKNWDVERMSIIIDPCTDPEAMAALVEEKMDTVRFSIFGVAVLDLADESVHRCLLAALEERGSRFVGETPVIEF
jgi:hypothetical protein